MKILLDTCTFLWLASGDPQLSQTARDHFVNPGNDIYLSSVTAWEISVKHSIGRLSLKRPPGDLLPDWREKHGISALPLEEEAALYEGRLPKLHNDPFDRMLICQSIVHGMALLTPDHDITQYALHTLW